MIGDFRYLSPKLFFLSAVEGFKQCGRPQQNLERRGNSALMSGAFALVMLSMNLALVQAEKLTLAEAMEKAVKTDPAVQRSAEQLNIARLEEPEFLALTDPSLSLAASVEDDQSPRVAPAFEGPTTRTQMMDMALEQNSIFGTETRLFFNNQRIDNPAIFRPLNPSAESRLGFEIRQSLLRNFWGRPDISKRKKASYNVLSYEQSLIRSQEEAAARAALAYIQVWLTHELVKIQKSSVDNNKRLVEVNKNKLRYGLVENSDYFQAEASYQAKQTDLKLAQSRSRTALQELQAALHEPQNSHVQYEVSLPSAPLMAIPSYQEALSMALINRPDFKSAQFALEQKEWAYRLETLQTMPELSITGAYTSAGLDGKSSHATSDSLNFEDEILYGGLEFRISLQRKREKIAREQARLLRELATTDVDRLKIQIEQEVANVLEELWMAQERVESYRRLVELESKKFNAEKENFIRGRSTTDVLIRFETDIQNSQRQVIEAQADLLSNWARLLFVTGNFLERARNWLNQHS